MRKKPIIVQFRRKKEGKTNYKKRLKLLLSNKPRIVIRPSLKYINVQIVEYHPKGDKTIVAANSRELEKFDWKFSKNNIPAAYLAGFLLGKKAVKKKVKEAILDIGLRTPTKGSKIFACLKGAVDAGVNVPFSGHILPSEDRITGKHIAEYSKKNQKIFSEYSKKNLDIAQMPKTFEEVKNKIAKVE
jgi:large subunit ribosomal protein L18